MTLALYLWTLALICFGCAIACAAIGLYRFGVAWMRSEDTFF